jgi:hypothetical protein
MNFLNVETTFNNPLNRLPPFLSRPISQWTGVRPLKGKISDGTPIRLVVLKLFKKNGAEGKSTYFTVF